MGPQGLGKISKGGKNIDKFPIEWENHLEGHLTNHWASNKAPGCLMKDEKEVCKFVCYFIILFVSIANIYIDFPTSCNLLAYIGEGKREVH
jgi:hypothetical protein